ncbi:MAG: extracellular solute-binding protein [Planctomycetes bacterium]|nr:extracellular solute-binding protein [Planctomycetota bacterium]
MSEPEPIDPNAQTRSLPGFVEVVSETATQPSSQPPASGSGALVAFAPGERFGQFEIIEELGRGGMGLVVRALDTDLGREVALKVLSIELSGERERERFRHEAALASKLRHPRIVGVYSYGEIEGRAFFTMPVVEGRSLKEELLERSCFPARRAAEVIRHVALAIDSAHQQRVIHRDLKPANLLLDPEGDPLILDFGLAKDLGRDVGLTMTGEIVGTPLYMAPEQVRGQGLDHRVDVYALGVILYELLTGGSPFRAETAGQVLHRILNSQPATPRAQRPDVPYALETVCLKAMARERMFRYQTAAELAEDLGRFLDDGKVLARRPGLAARVVGFARTHRSTTVLFFLLLAVVSSSPLWLWKGSQRLAARQGAEAALNALEEGLGAIEGQDLGLGVERLHRALILAEEAFAQQPEDPVVRDAYLRVLAERAHAAERERDWGLAAELWGRRTRLTGSDSDRDSERRALGKAEVVVAGLAPEARLRFRRYDNALGRWHVDPERVATAAEPKVALRAGTWVAALEVGEGAARARYLLPLARGERRVLAVRDPGPAPPGMRYVPGARFSLGRLDGDGDEAPRAAEVDGFWLDRTEVTVADYRRFLTAVAAEGHARCGPACRRARSLIRPFWVASDEAFSGHRPLGWRDAPGDEEFERQPVTGITWADAASYAAAQGKRLPTEAEWELAAGGLDGRRYPWGDRWEVRRANFHRQVAPVDAYPDDVSPYGIVGLAGNADEWCADVYADVPQVGGVEWRALRGGGWYDDPRSGGRISDRSFARASDRFEDTGFRCARDAEPGPRIEGALPPTRAPLAAPAAEPLELRVAAWPHYAAPRFSANFRAAYRAATGLDVRVVQSHTITSNDELPALLRAGEVDLVTPTCDFAPHLIAEGLVQPLELAVEDELIPFFQRPPWLQQRGQTYGAPYAFGSMWLRCLDPGFEPREWRDLWDPRVRGRVAIWDDAVWAVTLASMDLGLDPADLGPEELRRVEARLDALMQNGCRVWQTPEDALSLVLEGGVVLVDDWGILGRTLERRGVSFSTRVPDRTAVWVDSWMIGAEVQGPRLEAARAWVEFALSPSNQRDLLLLAGYDPTNRNTTRRLDKRSALAHQHALEAQIADMQLWPYLSSRAPYLELWQRVKARAGR